jgi:hypothetical protein
MFDNMSDYKSKGYKSDYYSESDDDASSQSDASISHDQDNRPSQPKPIPVTIKKKDLITAINNNNKQLDPNATNIDCNGDELVVTVQNKSDKVKSDKVPGGKSKKKQMKPKNKSNKKMKKKQTKKGGKQIKKRSLKRKMKK